VASERRSPWFGPTHYGPADGGGNLADAMAAKNPPRPISTINYFNKIGMVSPVRRAGLG